MTITNGCIDDRPVYGYYCTPEIIFCTKFVHIVKFYLLENHDLPSKAFEKLTIAALIESIGDVGCQEEKKRRIVTA